MARLITKHKFYKFSDSGFIIVAHFPDNYSCKMHYAEADGSITFRISDMDIALVKRWQ